MTARIAVNSDANHIAQIYNQAIEERIATFETRLRSTEDVLQWFDGRHPVVIVEDSGVVAGFATASAYCARQWYAGIAEVSCYVARGVRGRSAGRLALTVLEDAARAAHFWKFVSRIFVVNAASRALVRSLGFREVGIHAKHARLDGVWRGVIIVEKWIAG
jgi:L-amino acid N-acyltransferase YncA